MRTPVRSSSCSISPPGGKSLRSLGETYAIVLHRRPCPRRFFDVIGQHFSMAVKTSVSSFEGLHKRYMYQTCTQSHINIATTESRAGVPHLVFRALTRSCVAETRAITLTTVKLAIPGRRIISLQLIRTMPTQGPHAHRNLLPSTRISLRKQRHPRSPHTIHITADSTNM